MKRNFSTPILSACCFVFFMVAFAGIEGKWKGFITTPDGSEVPVKYDFKVDGDKLTGTAESSYGITSVDEGHVKVDSFYFNVTVEGDVYPHAGKIYNDSLSLDVDFGGQHTHTALTRPADK